MADGERSLYHADSRIKVIVSSSSTQASKLDNQVRCKKREQQSLTSVLMKFSLHRQPQQFQFQEELRQRKVEALET